MSKKTVQVLVEVTINNSFIDVSDFEVEKTINTALHIGLAGDMHDDIKEDICDNLTHFKTKVVKI